MLIINEVNKLSFIKGITCYIFDKNVNYSIINFQLIGNIMKKVLKPETKLFTKYLLIQLTISVFIAVAAAIIHLISAIADGNPNVPLVAWIVALSLILLLWVIVFPISKVWFNNLEYVIRDDRVSLYKGILTKTQKNVPCRAITDLALVRTLYDRLLKIGSVKIQTAGQSQANTGYEVSIDGMSNYQELHEEIKNRIKDLHPMKGTIAEEGAAGNSDQLNKEMLDELKKIRKNLENNNGGEEEK